MVANWYGARGGSIGIVVKNTSTGINFYSLLKERLPRNQLFIYSHSTRNEDSINVLNDGIIILNVNSVKGQAFDCVFILEFEEFIQSAVDANVGNRDVTYRKIYMMCARARDHLHLIYGPNQLPKEFVELLPGPDVLRHGKIVVKGA